MVGKGATERKAHGGESLAVGSQEQLLEKE